MFLNKQEACNAITNNCTGTLTLQLKNTTTLAVGVQLYSNTNVLFTQSGYLVKDSNVYTITNGIITAIETCSVNPCSINITATPSNCNTSTNLFNLSGVVTFVNPPSTGTLIVSTGNFNQTFNAPFTNNQQYSLTGLTSDGLQKTVTASFSVGSCSGSTTFTSPNSCTNNCSVSFTKVIGSCDSNTNKYSVTGVLTLTNQPTTGTLTISDGSVNQVFNAPFNSTLNYTLSNLESNGTSHTINVVFSASSCTSSQTYTAPISCVINNETAYFVTSNIVAKYNTSGQIVQTRANFQLNNNILTEQNWNNQFFGDSSYTKTYYLGLREHTPYPTSFNIDLSEMQGFDFAPIVVYVKTSQPYLADGYDAGLQTYLHVPAGSLNRRVFNDGTGKITYYVMPSSYVFNNDVRPQFSLTFPNFTLPNNKIVAISTPSEQDIPNMSAVLNKGVTYIATNLVSTQNRVSFDGDTWLYISGVPSNADNSQIQTWASNVTQSQLNSAFESSFYNIWKDYGLIMIDGEAIGGRDFGAADGKIAQTFITQWNNKSHNAKLCWWGDCPFPLSGYDKNQITTVWNSGITNPADIWNNYGLNNGLGFGAYRQIHDAIEVLMSAPNYLNTGNQVHHIYNQVTTNIFNKRFYPTKQSLWSTWEHIEVSGSGSGWSIGRIDVVKNDNTVYRKDYFYMAFPSYMQSVGAWSIFEGDGVYQWSSSGIVSANKDLYGIGFAITDANNNPITTNAYGLNSEVYSYRGHKNIDWLMAGVWAVSENKDIINASTSKQFTEISFDGGTTWRTGNQAYVWEALDAKTGFARHKLSADGNTALCLVYNGFNAPENKQTVKVRINNKVFDIDIFGQYTTVARINLN